MTRVNLSIFYLVLAVWGCDRNFDVTGSPSTESCEGVSCWNPSPNECTAEGLLEIHNAYGYCVDGECQYESREEECLTGTCANGVCQDNPCQGVTCSTPPDSQCEDGYLARWSDLGFCTATGSQASCVYTKTLNECRNGCADGACIDEPCVGITCETPPARYCEETSLIVWNTLGVCVNGGCEYAFQTVVCHDGCSAGACVGDLCEGIVCDSPPAAYCSDNMLVTYGASGTCEGGTCNYSSSDTDCAAGCSEGRCLDASDTDTSSPDTDTAGGDTGIDT
ncbi:MAG: hypothetical protein JXX29_23000 [Deltaproteobacteria bacterium]|nr:hypothetical protein [Deltaproteobacteria bacterium]MBN2674568.1 hypothetical protein [Deltaproteobacteria bacterium]